MMSSPPGAAGRGPGRVQYARSPRAASSRAPASAATSSSRGALSVVQIPEAVEAQAVRDGLTRSGKILGGNILRTHTPQLPDADLRSARRRGLSFGRRSCVSRQERSTFIALPLFCAAISLLPGDHQFRWEGAYAHREIIVLTIAPGPDDRKTSMRRRRSIRCPRPRTSGKHTHPAPARYDPPWLWLGNALDAVHPDSGAQRPYAPPRT